VQFGQEEVLTAAGPALVVEALRRFAAVRVRVHGTSMLPAIRPRDVLVVQHRQLETISVGDIVLFASTNRLFAHRVVRTHMAADGRALLVTKGDTHSDADLPIDGHQLLGQVVAVWREGRARLAPFPYSRLSSLVSLGAVQCVQLASRFRARRGMAAIT
jgi:peptidase S24-like protein